MKLSTLIDPRFNAALKRITSLEVPLAVAQKIKAIIASIRDEMTAFEAAKKELYLKYGNKNADGTPAIDEKGQLKIEGDNMKDFVKEVEALMAKEVNLPKIEAELLNDLKISADEFQHIEELLKL